MIPDETVTPDTELPTQPEPESIRDKAREAGIGVDDTDAQNASIVAEKHRMSQEAAERAGADDDLSDLEDDEGEYDEDEDTVQEELSAEDDDKPGSTQPPEDEVGSAG